MAPKKPFVEWTKDDIVDWLRKTKYSGAEALVVYVHQSNIDGKTLLSYNSEDHEKFLYVGKDNFEKILKKARKEDEKTRKKKKNFWGKNTADPNDSGVESGPYSTHSEGNKRKIHVNSDSPCSSAETSGTASFGVNSGGGVHKQTDQGPVQQVQYDEHTGGTLDDIYNDPEELFITCRPTPRVPEIDPEPEPQTKPSRPVPTQPQLPRPHHVYPPPSTTQHVYPPPSSTNTLSGARINMMPQPVIQPGPDDMYMNQEESSDALYMNQDQLPPPPENIPPPAADEWEDEDDQPIYMNQDEAESESSSSEEDEEPELEDHERADMVRRLTAAMHKFNNVKPPHPQESTYLNNPPAHKPSAEVHRPPLQPPHGGAPFFPEGRSPMKPPAWTKTPVLPSPEDLPPRDPTPTEELPPPPPPGETHVPRVAHIRGAADKPRNSVAALPPFTNKLNLKPVLNRHPTTPNIPIPASIPTKPVPSIPTKPKPSLINTGRETQETDTKKPPGGSSVKDMLAKFNPPENQDKNIPPIRPRNRSTDGDHQPGQSIRERMNKLGDIPVHKAPADAGLPGKLPTNAFKLPTNAFKLPTPALPPTPAKPLPVPPAKSPDKPAFQLPPARSTPSPSKPTVTGYPPAGARPLSPPAADHRRPTSPPGTDKRAPPPLPGTPIPGAAPPAAAPKPGMYEDVQIQFPLPATGSSGGRAPLPPPPHTTDYTDDDAEGLYQLEDEEPEENYTESDEWFPGYMPSCSRLEAQRLLEEDGRPQCFLVRDSDKDARFPHVISMIYNGSVDHIRLGLREGGKLAIGATKESEVQHNTLGALVFYHTTTPLNLVGRLIKLKNPIKIN